MTAGTDRDRGLGEVRRLLGKALAAEPLERIAKPLEGARMALGKLRDPRLAAVEGSLRRASDMLDAVEADQEGVREILSRALRIIDGIHGAPEPPPSDLDQLLALLERQAVWEGAALLEGVPDTSALPVFGGGIPPAAPDGESGILSWDAERLLVGDPSSGSFRIVPRARWAALACATDAEAAWLAGSPEEARRLAEEALQALRDGDPGIPAEEWLENAVAAISAVPPKGRSAEEALATARERIRDEH